MKTASASGTQVAILIFAVVLLAVPATNLVAGYLPSAAWRDLVAGRFMPFALGAVVILAFPPLRKLVARELRAPLPRGCGAELAAAQLLYAALAFAFAGGIVMLAWLSGGTDELRRTITSAPTHEEQWRLAFTAPVMAKALVAAGLIAPVMEEVAFRGLLYRAWERRWGWIPAMLASSLVFALYHSHFWSAFPAAILLVCVYRRAGTLWAPILIHAVYNISLWYPLLGQFLTQRYLEDTGSLWPWAPHIAALALVLVALPAYVYMSRDARAHAEALPDGALPR